MLGLDNSVTEVYISVSVTGEQQAHRPTGLREKKKKKKIEGEVMLSVDGLRAGSARFCN